MTIGTDGGALEWDKIIEFETLLSDDNADVDNMGFLTTPRVVGYLKSTLRDPGSGQYLMNPGQTTLNGYNIMTSTQVPSNLTKGSGTNLHAAIFGNWAELLIGQWGPLDIVVDPYTASKNAQVTIVVNGWFDIAVRHAVSFAICDEIDPTVSGV